MKIHAFILDFGAAKATRRSLELSVREPEPLVQAPPETLGFIAVRLIFWRPAPAGGNWVYVCLKPDLVIGALKTSLPASTRAQAAALGLARSS